MQADFKKIYPKGMRDLRKVFGSDEQKEGNSSFNKSRDAFQYVSV